MFIHKKNGFTVLEAVVAIAIISFVLVSSVGILISLQNQNKALNSQINAASYAALIRDEVLLQTTISEIQTNNFDGQTKTLTEISLETILIDPAYDFYSMTTITFEPIEVSVYGNICEFIVTVTYYNNRTYEVRGILYE
jgi:type II secretory pathway component PulJ